MAIQGHKEVNTTARSFVEKFKETLNRSISLNTVINHSDYLEDACLWEKYTLLRQLLPRTKGILRTKIETIWTHKML